MTVKTFNPKTRDEWLNMRGSSVGASAIGCLLGQHDYWTPFSLWAVKIGSIAEDPEESPAMQRGRLLEKVAVELLREQHPDWTIDQNEMPGGRYFVDNEFGLSATPDAFVTDHARPGFGVVQIKSVEAGIFKRRWKDEDGDLTPPLWIAVQAIIDAGMSGASWAAIAPLVVSYGLELPLIDVPLTAGVLMKAKAAAAQFWGWVRDETPPPVDFAKDGRALETLYQPTGEIIDLSGDNMLISLIEERDLLAVGETAAEKRGKEIKAEILSKLNGAGAARIADGRLITAKRIERAAYSVAPTSFIDVRVKRS